MIAFVGRGTPWSRKNDYDKAIADYTEAIKLDPRTWRLSTAAASPGTTKKNTTRRSPISPRPSGSIPTIADAYAERGRAWASKNDDDKAIADYTEAIRIDPRTRCFQRPWLRWSRKNEYDKAIADYTEAIRLDPKTARLAHNRGTNWAKKKNTIRRSPISPRPSGSIPATRWAYTNRGAAWAARRNTTRRSPTSPRPSDSIPEYARAYFNRGVAWSNKKDYDKAIADFTEAIRIDPRYASAYTNRGLAWSTSRSIDKAIADYTQAIRIDPGCQRLHRSRQRLGRPRRIRQGDRRFHRGHPHRPGRFERLHQSRQRLGQEKGVRQSDRRLHRGNQFPIPKRTRLQ